jgi:bifunctional oligoribonuclease and PAP phosphatase NrnA
VSNTTFEQIGRVLRENQRFAILSHVRPDGDALGSQLALALSLQQLGMDVRVWNEDGMLEKYSFLPRAELLTRPPATADDVDVAIALDTAIQNRLGTALAAVGSAKIWINIDHHRSNPGYGDVVIVDPTAPATGEIIFRLIKSQGLPLDHDIAENLYAAISTDTGSFQYPNTSARTFEIAAELVRVGNLDVGQISKQLYESYPRRRLELLRELLRTMRFSECGRVASFSLSLKTAADLAVLPEDNEGLIDHLRAIRGVIVAVFFEELADGKVRVSMRSKDEAVDVCAICQKFGGGGHTLAAGARVRGSLAEVEKKVLEEIREVLKRRS